MRLKYEEQVSQTFPYIFSLYIKKTFFKDQKSSNLTKNGKVALKKESLQLDVPIKGLL